MLNSRYGAAARVISLAPSVTELVFALGGGKRLVGRTSFCDHPEEAKRIPSVGGWTTANVEAVVALKPDLVLTSTFLQDEIVAALRAQGVPVCHTDPRILAEVLESFETIAGALGVPERGRSLRAEIECQLESLPAASHLPRPRVYAEEWPDPPMASGNWVPELIARAGGQSFLTAGERSRAVTLEEVAAFGPEVIVLNYCGMERVLPDAQVTRVRKRPGWESLRAVQARRIFVVPDSLLNRPGPRLAEGVRALQRAYAAAWVSS